MTHAYDQAYLSKVSKTIGNMLHIAVLEFDYDGNDFLHLFVQSGIAEQIENGNPKYLAGKSGMELFLEVVERTTGNKLNRNATETYERSDVYWAGWILAHYQWYSGRTFQDILGVISYSDLLNLYGILHEADVQKSYEIFDKHFKNQESKLKIIRGQCDMTQEELSRLSGVPLNTIRAYEQGSKDIEKAQVGTIMSLAKALKCDITDIIDG